MRALYRLDSMPMDLVAAFRVDHQRRPHRDVTGALYPRVRPRPGRSTRTPAETGLATGVELVVLGTREQLAARGDVVARSHGSVSPKSGYGQRRDGTRYPGTLA